MHALAVMLAIIESAESGQPVRSTFPAQPPALTDEEAKRLLRQPLGEIGPGA